MIRCYTFKQAHSASCDATKIRQAVVLLLLGLHHGTGEHHNLSAHICSSAYPLPGHIKVVDKHY
jgi:hypothetical protein